jgi:hypothetical protein
MKATIFTGISVAAVKKIVEKIGKAKKTKGEVKGVEDVKVDIPVPGKGYHDWWVVPKIVPTP